ncbi:MAG: ABC transporter, permease protein 2 (cluster 11, riboflavin/purine nucleoside/unknown) [Olavius algarvensis Delta 4 endosymbiont]|nr:MAG: ABC transporter, permease protein 2 (cluster 11, riboflavin/purine nucleoside/unknown) [Olavius algarvensis Delta 4 endosymbiont]
MEIELSILLASVVAGATPILLATLGETITEKAGIINLSLDGSILLSAMAAFVVTYNSGSLLAGFIVGALVGAAVALVVALFSIYLEQSQVAVGFVLTLTTRDLAYFLGNDYSRLQGPQVTHLPIPLLSEVPFVGPVFFNHNLPVYFSLVLVGLCWWYIYWTPAGLKLRSVGEHPRAAYARGIDPKLTQLLYTMVGGLLVGLAGATFSLATKPGWGRPQGAEGTGWIALALVIFGGWHPLKAAAGAFLFAFLQVMGIYLQGWFPSLPSQVFQVAPFPLMIFTLLLMSASQNESVQRFAAGRPALKPFLQILSGAAPAALGKPYRPD